MTRQFPEAAAGARIGAPWLQQLGSLRLTAVILLLLLGCSLAALVNREQMTWPLVLPLALFALNICCALFTYPAFRQQTALLVFHLALLAIVLLVAAARLTYLKGSLEVMEGEVFDGRLVAVEAGPWHWSRLDRAHFQNLGFSTKYVNATKRILTRNQVRWIDEAGAQREAVIGDLEPLSLHGYRFYADLANMGFSTVLVWLPKDGAPERGSVNFPSYPGGKFRQQQQWTPPGDVAALTMVLQIDQAVLDPMRPSQFQVPSQHSLLVRKGDVERTLQPGERLELPGGTLVYEGLRRWLGYNVVFDWSIPWLLAAGILAVISLTWHLWRKFAAQPWLDGT